MPPHQFQHATVFYGTISIHLIGPIVLYRASTLRLGFTRPSWDFTSVKVLILSLRISALYCPMPPIFLLSRAIIPLTPQKTGGSQWPQKMLPLWCMGNPILPQQTRKVAERQPGATTQTVLVVDDDVMLLAIIASGLEQYGFRVLKARGAQEALRLCEHHEGPIHVLLADVVLPRNKRLGVGPAAGTETSGPDVARRILALRPDIRVIFITGHTDETVRSLGVTQPGSMILKKPFSVDCVVRKVREVLTP
jgi:CheY-like chemotaxis protein